METVSLNTATLNNDNCKTLKILKLWNIKLGTGTRGTGNVQLFGTPTIRHDNSKSINCKNMKSKRVWGYAGNTRDCEKINHKP